jgi:hypothetical protein
MRFEVPANVIDALRARRAQRRWHDGVEDQHDAFVLDPGMGPALYLTTDGRVLVDGSAWDDSPVREATDDEAVAALVVGAKKTGIAALIDLLPSPPTEARDCATCGGARWSRLPVDSTDGQPIVQVCSECSGRGWVK